TMASLASGPFAHKRQIGGKPTTHPAASRERRGGPTSARLSISFESLTVARRFTDHCARSRLNLLGALGEIPEGDPYALPFDAGRRIADHGHGQDRKCPKRPNCPRVSADHALPRGRHAADWRSAGKPPSGRCPSKRASEGDRSLGPGGQ